MKQLDLEPKDYRTEPVKGARVFHRGGLLRLAVVVAVVLTGVIFRDLIATLVHMVLAPVLG